MDKTFAHIQVRRDTEERWERLNPDLLEGEWGFEVDTGKAKLGIGKAWADTEYFGGDVDLSAYATKEELAGEKEDRTNADILLQKQIAELREQFIKVIENLDGVDGDQIEILLNGVVSLEQFTDLLEKLEKEIGYRVQGDLELWDGLKAEKEDRQQADRLIENHIARLDEKVENNLTINAGESYDDSDLREKLEQEKYYRVEGDAALQSAINANTELIANETKERIDADDGIKEKLEYEALYRVKGDEHLQKQIDALEAAPGYDDSGLREKIEQEKGFRVEADADLLEMIRAEKGDRQAADQAIENHIARVNNNSQQADASLAEHISAERADRMGADARIENHVARVADESRERDEALGEVIEGHRVDRVTADAQLQRQIGVLSEQFDKLIAGIDGIDSEEITVLLQSAASLDDLNAVVEKIEREIAYRIEGDAALQKQLDELIVLARDNSYDDSELREKLEKEKYYRVETDLKLQEQIDNIVIPPAYDDSALAEKLEKEKAYRVEGDEALQKQLDDLETPDLDAVAKAGALTDEFLSTGRRLNLDGHKLVAKPALTLLDAEDGVAPGVEPGRIYFDGQRLLTEADLETIDIPEAAKPVFYGAAPGPENPEDGDLWYNTDSAELLISTGGDWALIGPSAGEGGEEYDDSELRELIEKKADADHTHEADDIDLSGYALVDHTHEADDLGIDLSGYALVDHEHDDYVTKDELVNQGPDAPIGTWSMKWNSYVSSQPNPGQGLICGTSQAPGNLLNLYFHNEDKAGHDHSAKLLTLKAGDRIDLTGPNGTLVFQLRDDAKVYSSTKVQMPITCTDAGGISSVPNSWKDYSATAPHVHSEYALVDHTHEADDIDLSGYALVDHTHDDYALSDHVHDGDLTASGKVPYHANKESDYRKNGVIWTVYKQHGNGSVGLWFDNEFDPPAKPGDRIIWLRTWTDANNGHSLLPDNQTQGQWHRCDQLFGGGGDGGSGPELDIDGALIFKGVVANEGELASKDQTLGHFYYNEADSKYYAFDGNSWVQAGEGVDVDLSGYALVDHKHQDLADQIQALQEKGAVVAYQEDPPENPEPGALWYRTTTWELFIWHSTGWVYVNGGSGGGGGGNACLHYGDSAPDSPSNGMLWFKTDVWDLYVWHHNAWVVPNAQHHGLKEEAVQDVHTVAVIVADDIPATGRFGKELQTGEMWFSTKTFRLHIYNQGAWMALSQ